MKFEHSLIMRKIIWKMAHSYSPIILITGVPNSGKTQLSGLIAETIHPMFNGGDPWVPKKYLLFDMNTFSHQFLQSRKKIFVVAEAGYDLAFDQWYDKTNRFFDKIITTQRIMGNCYILNIPVGKDLARRHRRKVDFILDVRGHGYFKASINRLKRGIMSGDEFKPFWLEDYTHVPLPKCHKLITKLDIENKERIRTELIEDYQADMKKKEEIRTKIKETYAQITCGACNYSYAPRKPKPRSCPECNKRFIWEKKPKTKNKNPNLIELKT